MPAIRSGASCMQRHLLSNSFTPSHSIWYLYLVPEVREGIYCDNNLIINTALRAVEESWEPKAATPWERCTQDWKGGGNCTCIKQHWLLCCSQPLLGLLAQSWLVCTAPGSAVEPPKVWACLFLAQGLGREKVPAVGRYSASLLEVDCLGIFLQFTANYKI